MNQKNQKPESKIDGAYPEWSDAPIPDFPADQK
jgi:hypothetical protein